MAIEWAERGEDILPKGVVHVDISKGDDSNSRIIQIYKRRTE